MDGTRAAISTGTHLGPVHLTVSALNIAIPFYQDVLGLRLFDTAEASATLGAGDTPLLVLRELPGAQPKPAHTTGLYHFAILLPSRVDLARQLRQLVLSGYPLGGAADHLVSEALYLADPDGNGIEIYADRPRNEWPYGDGGLRMATDPLNVQDLLAGLNPDEGWDGMPAGTRMGHVHLHVADLERAVEFYHGVLGFDVVTRYGPQAAFLSAGGYHHHVGLNTWAGVGAPPPPPDSAGLDHFTIYLPTAADLRAAAERLRGAGLHPEEGPDGLVVRDPSENTILLGVDPVRVPGR